MNGSADRMRAGLWQRTAGWTLDAAILAPFALVLSGPWLAPAWDEVQARWQALLQHAAELMAAAIVAGVPLPALVAQLLHEPGLTAASAALQLALWHLLWPPVLAFAGLGALWQAGFESSHWQASPGRRLLALEVVDDTGRRIGGARALLRHGAGALSWLTLNIGHVLVAAGPAHLALHDRVSGTRVLARRAQLPHWARAWLLLLTAMWLAACGWLAWQASGDLAAALERALYPPLGAAGATA